MGKNVEENILDVNIGVVWIVLYLYYEDIYSTLDMS